MLNGQRIAQLILALIWLSLFLAGCGTAKSPVLPASSSSVSSVVTCPGGAAPCHGSVNVPLLIVDGSDPASYGLPISCSVTAGTQAMKFIASPSTSWFGVNPGSGTLDPASTTTVSVNAMNAANVSTRNIGSVTVSAPGYNNNSQMGVELNCNIEAGTCTVAFSCEPSKYPLP